MTFEFDGTIILVPNNKMQDQEVVKAVGELKTLLLGAERPPQNSEEVERFLDTLDEGMREFLRLVEEKGVLGILEATENEKLPSGKELGGKIGALVRWAKKYGLYAPFDAIRGEDGMRAWRWVGWDRTESPPRPEYVRSQPRKNKATESFMPPGVTDSEREFWKLIARRPGLEQTVVMTIFQGGDYGVPWEELCRVEGVQSPQQLQRLIVKLGEAIGEAGLEHPVRVYGENYCWEGFSSKPSSR